MKKGAEQAVKLVSLNEQDKVVIITDKPTSNVASAVFEEVGKKAKQVELFFMEDFGERPISFNDIIKQRIMNANVLYYIAQSVKGELNSFRMPMIDTVRAHGKLRFAHMIGITEEIMKDGMSTDYSKIKEVTQRIHEITSGAKNLHLTTDAGTNLRVQFNPRIKWVPCDGHIHEGKWTNLPDGEIFTSPDRADGVLIVDGVLGDYFTQKYGCVENHPVKITIENSRITQVECKNKELLQEFKEYIKQDANSNRVGELGIGTNIGLKKLIGNLLQDEKFPGVHIAFGDPYGKETGAEWSSNAHIDVVMQECNISINDKKIMKKGKFLI
ncbi:aminopeptidase [archaeon]|nr:aminopeptidase [archaeon]